VSDDAPRPSDRDRTDDPSAADPASESDPDRDRERASDPDSESMSAQPAPDGDPEDGTDDESGRDVERYVRYVLLAGFTLLALVALLRFYFAASGVIDTWVTEEYRSLFQAAFNLVVLLAAGIGISWQVRHLA